MAARYPVRASAEQQPPPFPEPASPSSTSTSILRRNGRLIEGLRKEDFQVLEDGKPQAVEAFEFIRIEPNVPDAERRDPNTKEDGEEQAKDPHARVFVVYLDTLHTAYSGALQVKQPLLDFLNRAIGPKDLFGVMTREVPVRQLVLARRTETFEADLANNLFDWNPVQGDLPRTPDEEQLYTMCRNGPGLLRAHREDQFLTSLEELMTYLGALRDERKDLLFVSGGWLPDAEEAAARSAVPGATGQGHPPLPTPPRVTPQWNDGPGTDGRQLERDLVRSTGRSSELRLSAEVQGPAHESAARQRELLSRRCRRPEDVRADGLDAGHTRRRGVAGRPWAGGDRARQSDDDGRWGADDRDPSHLADNTDGRAIVNTNDIASGFRQIADDLSAYYLLGYSSTNAALDGKFRQIQVKVNQSRVSVSARKGYVAALPAAAAPSSTQSTAVSEVAEALALLPRPGEERAPLQPASPKPHVLVGEPAGFRAASSPRAPLSRSRSSCSAAPNGCMSSGRSSRRSIGGSPGFDRNGRPLALNVALAEQPGVLVADLTLAPLAEGEYVIELTAGADAQTDKRLLGFRVVR